MKDVLTKFILLILLNLTIAISGSTLKKHKLIQSDINENISTLSDVRPFDNETKATLQVVGQATQMVETDLVKIQLSIVTLDDLAKISLRKNTIASNTVLDKINSFNIEKKNLTTIEFSIKPKYNFTHDQSIFVGYETTNTLEINLGSIELAATLIDALSKLPVQNIGVSFEISNFLKEYVKDSLIEQAVLDAERLAKLTLRTTNNEVKSVKSITINKYSQASFPQIFDMQAEKADFQFSPTLFTNRTEIKMSVYIVFWIGAKEL